MLGIDPGSAKIGWGIIKTTKNLKSIIKTIDYGSIETSKEFTCEERLQTLYNELVKIIKKFKPDLSVVEQLFFFRNAKTAMGVAQARGVILLALQKSKIKIEEFTPLQIKMALTGYGRSSKSEVQKKVKSTLKLKQIPRPNHAADALAACVCYCKNN
ncbi:crossover junction endodeoxyribonuclease RuvC [bacterium]|nr:crossover junction endodeoxyribonuclease RuvC [bacterium]